MASMRRPGRNFLFVPGPTNVPDRVQRAMVVAMEDHRSSAFPELTKPLFDDLKKVFKSRDGQAFIFPASGTGCWEAALANTLSPGDKVLAPRFGQFSSLWIDLAQRLQLQVEIQDEDWGAGANPERIHAALEADKTHSIKGVLLVHNETATGVTSDVAAVRRAIDAAKHPALFYVDGVSSIASIDFHATEWGVDCVVAGSQKGFMMPPGLGFLCMSPKALEAAKTAKMPRAYFDLADQIKANATGYFPFTPAIGLLHGLRAALDCLFEEGLEEVFARHTRLANATRAAVDAWGLSLCARDPKWHSNTVSAVLTPQGIDAAKIIDTAFKRYDLALGTGLSKVAGKLFRIGHVGDVNELMLLGALAGAEMSMLDCGVAIEPGSGVAAAQTSLRQPHAVKAKELVNAH